MNTITYEESLLLNFFNQEIYFVFDNEEDVKNFIEYLKLYDNRDFSRSVSSIKSIAWIKSKNLHHSQMEWMNDEVYFKEKYEMRPVDYQFVKNQVNLELMMMRTVVPTFKELFKGILETD